jgi:transposase
MKASSSPSAPNRRTRFCGIDVAKNKHVACVIDRDGELILRSQSFTNDAEGYQHILARLQKVGGPGQVAVAMEATGHYWYSLHDFLVHHRYAVAVLNPIQTAQQAKKSIRKTQTDRIDARHIAVLLKNGEHRPAIIPGELAMTCRQLTRLRLALIHQQTRTKQLLWSRLFPVWPEYEALFATPFCKTGRTLLEKAPTPQDVLAMPQQQLNDLIRNTSRGKYGEAQAKKVRQAAENSIGTTRGIEAARIGIRSLLNQIDAVRPIRKQLEDDIRALARRLPEYLLTLPGADPLSIVSLFGETDPIETFTDPAQLVAFAGLDPVVLQSGKPTAEEPARHISKRGSPFLRHTLWAMAHRACYQEGDLRDYWLRRRGQGLHHLAAVTAVTVKLTHVAWRIMTDRRDYLPKPPARKPSRKKP